MGIRSFFANRRAKKEARSSENNDTSEPFVEKDEEPTNTLAKEPLPNKFSTIPANSASSDKFDSHPTKKIDSNSTTRPWVSPDIEKAVTPPTKLEKSNSVEKKSTAIEDEEDMNEISTGYSLYLDGNGTPIYVVKQERAYLSILFSVAQTGILIAMMIECGVAHFSINPMIGPYPDALSYWGGKNAYALLYDHEWWRLVTPMLLHAGIFHLLCNVSVQLDVGAFYEKEWGSLIWFIIYIGSTVGGTILSTIVSPDTIGVGSSGAVCGLFGGKIAEMVCRCCENQKTEYRKMSHNVLVEQFSSTMCSVILILVFSFIPLVDWAAHVGGLLGGFALGMLVFSLRIKTMRWRIITFIFSLTITVMFYLLTFLFMYGDPNGQVREELRDVCGYYMQIYDDYECNCMLERHQNQDQG